MNKTSIIKYTALFYFIDKNLDNIRFVNVHSIPAVSHLPTPKQNVEDALDKPTLVRKNQGNSSINFNLTNVKVLLQILKQ